MYVLHMHTYKHAHIYVHAHTHTHTHAYVCTNIYVRTYTLMHKCYVRMYAYCTEYVLQT